MRVLVIAVSAFVFVGSALAGNIALTSLGATAMSNVGTWQSFDPTNAIDGIPTTEWVGPPSGVASNMDGVITYTGPAYLLITLAAPTPIDYVTVQGIGNPYLFTAFNVYAGTSSDVATLEGGTPLLQVTDQADGTAWSDTGGYCGFFVGTCQMTLSAPIVAQYILYVAENVQSSDNNGCSIISGGCTPGDGTLTSSGNHGQDDAFATSVMVDAVPEPATLGLFGLPLLGLCLVRRTCK